MVQLPLTPGGVQKLVSSETGQPIIVQCIGAQPLAAARRGGGEPHPSVPAHPSDRP